MAPGDEQGALVRLDVAEQRLLLAEQRALEVRANELERYTAALEQYRRDDAIRVYHLYDKWIGASLGFLGGLVCVAVGAVFWMMNPFTILFVWIVMIVGGVPGLRKRLRGHASPQALAVGRAAAAFERAGRLGVVAAEEALFDRIDAIPDVPRQALPQALAEATAQAIGEVEAAASPAITDGLRQGHIGRLVDARRVDRLIPVSGAGLSLRTDVGGGFPKWEELPARLLAEADRDLPLVWSDAADRDTFHRRALGRGVLTLDDLLAELDHVKEKFGVHYVDAVTAIYRPEGAAPGSAHRALLDLGTAVLGSTALDRLLEDADAPPRSIYTWQQSTRAEANIQRGQRALLRFHGGLEDERSIVLTRSEYAAHGDPAHRKLLARLLDQTLLFVGYGVAHPQDLGQFVDRHADLLQGGAGTHYALLPSTGDPLRDVERRSLLRRHRIVEIVCEEAELVSFLEALTRRARVEA